MEDVASVLINLGGVELIKVLLNMGSEEKGNKFCCEI